MIEQVFVKFIYYFKACEGVSLNSKVLTWNSVQGKRVRLLSYPCYQLALILIHALKASYWFYYWKKKPICLHYNVIPERKIEVWCLFSEIFVICFWQMAALLSIVDRWCPLSARYGCQRSVSSNSIESISYIPQKKVIFCYNSFLSIKYLLGSWGWGQGTLKYRQ